MNIKRRWNKLSVLGIAVYVMTITGTVKIANAYEYYMDRSWSYYWDASGTDSGQGYITVEDGNASSIEPQYGVADCECEAYAWTRGYPADVSADVYAHATYWIDWTWTGPPGEAPGGTFTWEVHGDGTSWLEDFNVGVDGNAYSESYGTSAMGCDTETDETYAYISTWGWAQNIGSNDDSDCGYSMNVEPNEAFTVTSFSMDADHDAYTSYCYGSIHWEFDNEDEEEISAGTTYVILSTGVMTQSYAESISTGYGYAEAETWNYSHLFVEESDFDY